jgi:hypothetical protein
MQMLDGNNYGFASGLNELQKDILSILLFRIDTNIS